VHSYSGRVPPGPTTDLGPIALYVLIAVLALALVVFLLLRRRSRVSSQARAEQQRPSEQLPAQPLPSDIALPPISADLQAARIETAETPSDVPRPAEQTTAREQDIAAMRSGLANTRGGLVARLAKLFGGRAEIDEGLLEEIEEVLITADLGVKTSERILTELRDRMRRGELKDESSVWTCIRAQAQAILDVGAPPIRDRGSPAVILMIGVNGVGKTTTIGKLASRYVAQGKKVLLAAGDTYRAAAVLQLEMWGKRVGAEVVRGPENADPGSVIFDAVRRGREGGFDLVIADTAGRLHTKAPLMDELKKVERTIAKANDGQPPDEVFLVLDATTGQNALQQMKIFREVMGVTGVVLTKMDGTAKGGIVLGVVDQQKVPVRFIGLGEKVEDLREFDARVFVEALFSKPADATLAA
jgi:fused signal recognition particle receptor